MLLDKSYEFPTEDALESLACTPGRALRFCDLVLLGTILENTAGLNNV